MSATILAGTTYAPAIRAELAALATEHQRRFGYAPELAIVSLRAQESKSASDVYVHQLRRAARVVGVVARVVELPLTTTAAELHAVLADLNVDVRVRGIIVQLPLPPHLGRETLLDVIDPAKDVDGSSATNAGNLFLNLPALVPATCAAVMEILDRAAIPIAGQRVVVIGASAVVGRPLALMLLRRDATVSICHIYTEDVSAFTRVADIIIVAAGKPNLLQASMVFPGTVVIDVGINILPDGSVTGDVDFAAVSEVASMITPVPGGVGPLTNLMVLRQTLLSLPAMP